MDLREFRVVVRIVDRLAKRALFAEKQMVALEGQCAEWKRIADELKAERNAERKAHDEYKERNREIFNGNQRLTAELAVIKDERDALRAECDDLRRVSPQEASHITPEGKQTAEGALPQPGDVVRLVREPSADTVGDTLKNSLDWPWESRWGCVGDRGEIVESVKAIPGARSVRIMNTGVKVWWPLSCIEVVKGVDK